MEEIQPQNYATWDKKKRAGIIACILRIRGLGGSTKCVVVGHTSTFLLRTTPKLEINP